MVVLCITISKDFLKGTFGFVVRRELVVFNVCREKSFFMRYSIFSFETFGIYIGFLKLF